MATEHLIEYCDGDLLLEAFVAAPDAPQPRPVVLVAHMWGGRVEFCCQKARELAELGYVGFALDLYGKCVTATERDECAALMQPLLEDRATLQRRLRRAVETARQLPYVDAARIAAIGYCFGGLCVQDLARVSDELAGVVSFHGLLTLPANLDWPSNRAQVLILHGHDDPMVSSDDEAALKAQMTDAGVDWQFMSYGHAMHAFTNPRANDPGFGTVYDERTARRSWALMTAFLAEVLA